MRNLLLRASAASAIAGGALRIVDSFTGAVFSAHTLEWFYFATDVFLMLGLVGWYVSRFETLGVPGMAGFVVAVFGILVIRSALLFGQRGYMLGAAMFLAGLIVMHLPSFIRREGEMAPPILWLVAAFVAAIAYFAYGPLAVPAGVIFGLGFVAAGWSLWRSAS